MVARLVAALGLVLASAGAEHVPAGRGGIDAAVVLAVDASGSISGAELGLQRRGYAGAVMSPEVLAAIRSGRSGRIALIYCEWSHRGSLRAKVPWTIVDDEAAARRFGSAILSQADARPSLGRQAGGTSISDAIRRSADLFFALRGRPERRIIDVSGDGPDDAGPEVVGAARDGAVSRGIVVNGLPIESGESEFDMADYYQRNVIGGAGAFVLPVGRPADFGDAVRTKMAREIAGVPATVAAMR